MPNIEWSRSTFDARIGVDRDTSDSSIRVPIPLFRLQRSAPLFWVRIWTSRMRSRQICATGRTRRLVSTAWWGHDRSQCVDRPQATVPTGAGPRSVLHAWSRLDVLARSEHREEQSSRSRTSSVWPTSTTGCRPPPARRPGVRPRPSLTTSGFRSSASPRTCGGFWILSLRGTTRTVRSSPRSRWPCPLFSEASW